MPLYKSYLRHTKIQISLLFPLPTILIVKIKDQNILFLRKKLMTPNFNDWACAFHHVHVHHHSIHPLCQILHQQLQNTQLIIFHQNVLLLVCFPCCLNLFKVSTSDTLNPWNLELASSHLLRITCPRGRYFKYRLSVYLAPNLSRWLDFVGVCCFG